MNEIFIYVLLTGIVVALFFAFDFVLGKGWRCP